jgi:hypothetical protein
MQMGLAAPLISLAAQGASAEDVTAEALRLARIPTDAADDLWAKAEAHCTGAGSASCAGLKREEFLPVVAVLWDYFQKGVEAAKAVVPTDATDLKALLLGAYETENQGKKKSGNLTAERIKKWPADYEHVTNYCAFRCGVHAGEHAGRGNTIVLTDYQAAFKVTEAEMIFLLGKARGGAPPPDRGGSC